MKNTFIRILALLLTLSNTNTLFAEFVIVKWWREDDNIKINGKKPRVGDTLWIGKSTITYTMTSDILIALDKNGDLVSLCHENFTPDPKDAKKILTSTYRIRKSWVPIDRQKSLKIEGYNKFIEIPNDEVFFGAPVQNPSPEIPQKFPKPDADKPETIKPQPIKQ